MPVNSDKDLSELEDRYKRLYADFENYKKRIAKQQSEMESRAGESIIKDLIEVLDDFDSYFEHSDDSGVELIAKKLGKILSSHGLRQLSPDGEEFSPEIAEAIQVVDVDDPDHDGRIVQVVRKGYTLNGNIIRYPKVIVGKHKEVD